MRIVSTESFGENALKMLVFGESGAGKTSLAKTIPEATLIISAEAGLLPLAECKIPVIDIATDDDGKTIPKEKRIARLVETYKYLQTQEARDKYRWIFIDSLTEIGQNLVEQLQSEFTERKDALVLWGEYSKRMRAIVKSFRDLPHYNVVMTALATVEKDENQRRINVIDLNGKISGQLPQFFDEVFFLHVSKDEDGNIKRGLVTSRTDSIVAKDRSGKLSLVEPCDLGLIAKKITKRTATVTEKGTKNV